MTLRSSVELDEPLSRFVFSRNHLFTFDGQTRARATAFLPAPTTGTTSVFRTRDLSEAEVWAIGNDVLASRPGRSLHARADVAARVPLGLGLSVSPSPPRGHADLAGWPAEKAHAHLLAQQLADAAKVYRNPSQA